jgi:hypothetical protein
MKSYKLSAPSFSTTVSLSLDALQGLYSAQLIAGLVSIEDKSYDRENRAIDPNIGIISNAGVISCERQYLFKLCLIDAPDPSERSIVEIDKYNDNTERYSFISPDDYFQAYRMFLSNPLMFNPISLDGQNISWNMEKTPYPAIANFDQSGVRYGNMEQLSNWINNDGIVGRLFTRSQISGRYFIGTSSSGTNTFMLLVSSNINEYMRGFYSFYRWLRDLRIIESIPQFYLYDYGREVILKSVNTRYEMLFQLPISITDIKIV